MGDVNWVYAYIFALCVACWINGFLCGRKEYPGEPTPEEKK